MNNIHLVQSIQANDTYLYLTVDGQSYQIPWSECSPRLAQATLAQKQDFHISPSGYGIHWRELDEDLAITPLVQTAKLLLNAPG